MTEPRGLLSVTDVARLHRCARSTAWRLLCLLERDHGLRLFRTGRSIRVDAAMLREALARRPPTGTVLLQREVASLRRRISTIEGELRRSRAKKSAG